MSARVCSLCWRKGNKQTELQQCRAKKSCNDKLTTSAVMRSSRIEARTCQEVDPATVDITERIIFNFRGRRTLRSRSRRSSSIRTSSSSSMTPDGAGFQVGDGRAANRLHGAGPRPRTRRAARARVRVARTMPIRTGKPTCQERSARTVVWRGFGNLKFRNTRVRARESSKVSWEPTGTLTPIDVDARPNRNSRDCSYAVTQLVS